MITANFEMDRSNQADETAFDTNPPPISILIADDEKRMADLLAKNCKTLGHHVAGIAKNGKEAVKLAQELRPDLVILDVNMPGMDGIEAATAILKNQKVAIIFSTGAFDSLTLRRVQSLGIGGYLVKPFSPAQLKVAAHMAVFSVSEARF
jgi:response regulator NasT